MKGGRSATEAHMPLRRRPSEPSPTATYLFGRHLIGNEDWRQFIEGW
jgi:hypothetical protein